LKGVFKGVEMAIAMRLHGLIMAASEGCRCFGMSYDPKVRRLMEESTCPGWDLADLLAEASTMIQQWIQQFEASPTLSATQRQTLTQQAQLHETLLTDIL
jgi:polysaccharide pyruvyl transferase WcaK-like protein